MGRSRRASISRIAPVNLQKGKLVGKVWTVVNDFPDYAVSNDGEIMRLTNRTCGKAGRVLKTKTATTGYLEVTLMRNGERCQASVHRLVAEHFVPNPDNKPCVNHKNGIKRDSNADNLEWVTYSENTQHACRTGLLPSGADASPAKLTDLQVIAIRSKYAHKDCTQQELAEKYGIDQTQISNIVLGKQWKHLPVSEKQPRVCSVDGCTSRYEAKGLCAKHYLRWWRKESPLPITAAA